MREDYGSEGLPPMADGARRAKKHAGVGFLPPESKGRYFGSDVDRNRPSAPSGWASDLRRGPRGVLKRKGEVIGGYAVAVARARGADAGGASAVDVGSASEEERRKIVGRSALEGVADEKAVRAGTWRRQHYTGGERIDWLEESRLARERSVELVSEGINEVIKVGRGGVLKYRPSNRKVCEPEKPSSEGRRKSSEGIHHDVKSPVGIGNEGLRKSPEMPVRIRTEARRKSPEEAKYDRKIPFGIGAEEHRKSAETVNNYGAGTNERSLVHEEKRIHGDDEVVPSVSHVDKEKEKSKSKSPSMDEVARDGGSVVLGVKLDSKECDQKSDCDIVALEASGSTRRGVGTKKVSRGSEKQKVREQIKSMLLNAGWKIELRPRKNRDYEDSVYVSPQGTGYWSITKAYDAFQSQIKHASSAAGNLNVGNKSRKSVMLERNNENLCAQNGPSSALSTDALSILKRNVVNKRGSKKFVKDNIKRPSGRMKTFTQRKSITDLNTNPPSSDEYPQNSSEDCCSPEGRSRRQRGCTLLPRNFDSTDSVGGGYTPYDGKRTILSWMIDLGTLPANGKVEYMNKKRTRSLLEGWITRDGIHCSCCSKILPVSKFEIHAGSKQRQPYQNIFVESSGSPLLQCLLAAWRSQEKYKGSGFCSAGFSNSDPNDDMCGICGDGGDLICCDGCPSVFHLGCLGIEMLPGGDWHCSTCSCKFCGEVENSVASSSTSIANLRICYLCQEKYHQDCAPEVVMPSARCGDSYISFCGSSCKKAYEKLQNLLGVKNELDAGLSWSVAQSSDVDSTLYPSDIVQRAECNAKVAVALQVLDECFLPIIDKMSGINMINNVAFNHGSNLPRLNFRGVYTFILERDDEIISVASIRISGTRFAEMPFIGTRVRYRHQGMCHLLLKAIESALSSLDIEKLVIPAVPQLANVWTKAFGFGPLDDTLGHEIKSTNAITFPGMDLLVTTLPKGKDTSGYRDAPRGSSFNAEHQPAALLSLKRPRSNSVSNINYEVRGKKLGNLDGEDEAEFIHGNPFIVTKGLGEDTAVADLSFDGTPGTHNLVGSRIKATRFLKSVEDRNLKTPSPVSSDNRKKRLKTFVANSAALSEDMVSDSCNNEEVDACVAPNGDDMSGYSDRCSNGKAVSVTNGKSCYLF